MNLVINLLLGYVKRYATAAILKTVAFAVLRECVKRSDMKTDDSLLQLWESVEDGDSDKITAAVAGVIDSLSLDAQAVANKTKKSLAK